MTKFQREVLTSFADYQQYHGTPVTRLALFGDGNVAKQDEAIRELAASGYLEDSTLRDHHWAIKYRVTPAGYTALGRPVPQPQPKAGERKPPVANGRKRQKVG